MARKINPNYRPWYYSYHWYFFSWHELCMVIRENENKLIMLRDDTPCGQISRKFRDEEDRKLKNFLGEAELKKYGKYIQRTQEDHIFASNEYSKMRSLAYNPHYLEEEDHRQKELERRKEYLASRTPEEVQRNKENMEKSYREYVNRILREIIFRGIPLYLFSRKIRYTTNYDLKFLRGYFFPSAYKKRQLKELEERIAEWQQGDAALEERNQLEFRASSGEVSPHSLNN
ncbi:hypothetical protein G7B40_040025 [Aetokthonos hydrillicola Thurmond2011]|jgi:hypothetical protein|uniref:Uncharacterized protein n=1 Tax=Aetokthonos hydrillicola Thurmond2011 TaxID=2712845 RepID=A0AAP5MEB4_9CYAN|nr:hypothetical protein [Aetokthonos hydrillicola]MBW4590088.1 hypothetical protein [Aetokthonos hydrillicola CCALA 1050]MDR9900679.1 hypothetical protein [Aetokthonos hydrillicola Thurmond2011]